LIVLVKKNVFNEFIHSNVINAPIPNIIAWTLRDSTTIRNNIYKVHIQPYK